MAILHMFGHTMIVILSEPVTVLTNRGSAYEQPAQSALD